MMRPIPTDTVTRCGAIMTIAADLGRREGRWTGDDQLRPMGTLSRCYFQVRAWPPAALDASPRRDEQGRVSSQRASVWSPR